MPTVFERMRKKQRAAQFLLFQMNEERNSTYSTDPEKIEAFFYAFLASGKTITYIARNNDEQWFWDWRNGRAEGERVLLDFLSDQRDAEQHRGEDNFDIEVTSVPYMGVATTQGMRMPGEYGPPSTA
jgi:hypothetical protein